MRSGSRFSIFRIFFATIAIVFWAGLAFIPYEAGLYYEHLDSFSGHIARGDQSLARDGLKDLEHFYRLNNKLEFVYLDVLAKKYLFQNSVYHQAAFDYVAGDFDKVVDVDLKAEDGFWASYLRGNARWRKAQGIFLNALSLPDKEAKQKQMVLAMEIAGTLVKDDYAQAVRSDPAGTLEPSWNFDLVSDPSTLMKGLQPKPAPVKVKLAEPAEGENEFGKEGKGDVGTKPKDLGSKGKSGPGKPGGNPRPRG